MISAEVIEIALYRKFRLHRYLCSNIYLFRYNWESDFFCMTRDGYTIEIEIKVSKNDFKADFRKSFKHRKMGKAYIGIESMVTDAGKTESTIRNCPNYFYYACPEGVISEDEVPEYAGLIYVDQKENVLKVKRAPKLHRTLQDYSSQLLEKFYWRTVNQRDVIANLKRQIEYRK